MITLGRIRLERFDTLLRQIEQLPDAIQRRVSAEIEASCLTIVRNAKRRAPKNMGRLIQGITYIKFGPLRYELISAADYSAYMEFGTKRMVRIPTEWAELASAYIGVSIDSGGTNLKQAIYKWAEQKGISKALWFPIYRKIARDGVRPHPFFIPALTELDLLEKRIGKYLNNVA